MISIKSWWSSIDKGILGLYTIIIICGFLSAMTSSHVLSNKLGKGYFYMGVKHIIYLQISFAVTIVISFLEMQTIIYYTKHIFLILIFTCIFLIVWGQEINGAKRWIRIYGVVIQPAEFLKPAIIIINSMIISHYIHNIEQHSFVVLVLSGFLFILIALQPDIGSAIMISIISMYQLYIGGISKMQILKLICIGLVLLVVMYFIFPHYAARIDKFMTVSNVRDQTSIALSAFKNGAMFGVGIGEGKIKKYLPDAHCDFIFAVIAEELGIVACLLIILIFSIVIYKCVSCIFFDRDITRILILSGIAVQIAAQLLINIASTINLIPTKGAALPFISHGGSAALSMACSFGIVLAITKKEKYYG